MLHCLLDNVVSTFNVKLPVPLANPEPSGHEHAPGDGDGSIRMSVGNILLMRSLDFKGEIFVPYIPTQRVLLLFPASIDERTRTTLSPDAEVKFSAFLRHVYRATGGAPFSVAAAMLCQVSGSAALVLDYATVDAALAALEVYGDRSWQDQTVRTSSLYAVSAPCQYVDRAGMTVGEFAETVRDLYYLPTCTLCAERLEPTLTGMTDTEEYPVCTCLSQSRNGTFAGGDPDSAYSVPQPCGCSCLQTSSCQVCQQLLSVQLGSTGGSGQPARCQDCRQSGDPWVCMICGYVGCSRYQAMHAKDHFVRSRHYFSINLLTQQIWDYYSDEFAHHVMFLVDASSGKTTRLQYPGKESATAMELLGTQEYDNEDGDERAREHSGKGSTATCLSAVPAKKVVSGKYDAKLSTSHAQYVTVIKSELDAMRGVYEQHARNTVRECADAAPMTQECLTRLLQHATPVTAVDLEEGLASHQFEDATREDARIAQTEAGAGATLARDRIAIRRGVTWGDKKHAGRAAADPYAAVFASLQSLVEPMHSSQEEEQSIQYGIQHLAHELEVREEESRSLEETVRLVESDLRVVVRRNVLDSLELSRAIEELESTLREIELNVTVQRQLERHMGSGDAAERMVVMGKGKKGTDARKKK